MKFEKCDIDIKVNSIDLNRVQRNFNSDLAAAYQSNYEATERLVETFKERAESLTLLITLDLVMSSFSDSEAEVLRKNIKYLDLLLDSFEGKFRLYKMTLDEYKKRCLE